MAESNFTLIKDKNGNTLAYTEDSILIYNVFVYKISRQVREEDCREYFQRFGEIVRFRFNIKPGTGRRRGSRSAFVHFKEPEIAANVLETSVHRIDIAKVVCVKACDSWHQPQKVIASPKKKPKFDETKTLTETTSEAQLDNEVEHKNDSDDGDVISLQDLDDDCLLLILKRMPLRDQMSFARSHERFSSVFELYAKNEYKRLSTKSLESMSLWNIRQFFMLVGEYIEHFTLIQRFEHKERERMVNFIQTFCPNLQTMCLDSVRIKVTNLHKLLSRKPKLKTLCLLSLTLNDHCLHAIKKLPKLENLTFSRCYNFTGRFLFMLPQLKSLRLYHCFNLQTTHLQKAFAVMTNLRALDLRGVECINQGIFEGLIDHNKELETLQISCVNNSYDCVAKLPKLKNLTLLCEAPQLLRAEFLQKLVLERGEQLEALYIISRPYFTAEPSELIAQLKGLKILHVSTNCGFNEFSVLENLVEIKLMGYSNIDNDSLLKLVEACKKLKWVNVQNTYINNDFAKKLLPLLLKSRRPSGLITFLVGGTRIDEVFISELRNTVEVKSVVDFVFSYPKSLKSYDVKTKSYELENISIEMPFFQIEHFIDSDSDEDEDEDEDFFDELDVNELNFLFDMQGLYPYILGEENDDDDDDSYWDEYYEYDVPDFF